jgi:DNA invertase Pin-like site-specific DNA recombinase
LPLRGHAGRKGGRKPKLSPKQIAHARRLLEDRTNTLEDAAASFGVNRATIYRSLGLGRRDGRQPD